MSVLWLGDRMEVNLFWMVPVDSHTRWLPVVVKGFEGDFVRVEAVDVSDDPLVENEWAVPFRALRRPANIVDTPTKESR